MNVTHVLPDIIESESEMNGEMKENEIQVTPIESVDWVVEETDNDTLSVTGTSSSFGCYPANLRNNTEANIRPSLVQRIDCLENCSTSNADIGRICVQNSTDVTFGNKTFFYGPVEIKQFSSDGEQKPDVSETSKT